MSINLSRILTDAAHVARAREALGGLLALFVIAVFVLIPGQRPEALGWELIGFSLVIVAIAIRLQGQTIARIDRAGRLSWAIRTLPLNSGTLTLVVAGVSLVRGAGGGLYWLVPTIIIYFSWAALNAWILVVGASDRTK